MGNRDDLLAGAKQCLVEKGYAATTVRDIAGAARVSMAAIGYHFGSREALLNRALFDLMEQWGATVAGALASADGNDAPARRYQAMWSRMIESFTADPSLFLASIDATVLSAHTPQLREQIAEGIAEGRSGMAATLLGVDEGDLDDDTVRTLGSVQLALISGILLQRLTDPDRGPSAADVVAGLRALADLIDGQASR